MLGRKKAAATIISEGEIRFPQGFPPLLPSTGLIAGDGEVRRH
jgi:hypothetical protein